MRMPDYIFFEPLTAHRVNSPEDPTAPMLLLFDPAPFTAVPAQTLATSGWLVLVANSTTISFNILSELIGTHPAPDNWLTPRAVIITTTDHNELITALEILAMLSLTPASIPHVLYTRTPQTKHHSTFGAVIPSSGYGETLLTHITALTGIIFCAECKTVINPHDKALLSTPYLYCAKCATGLIAVPHQALFPARLLARAARVFVTEANTYASTTIVAITDLWDMSHK